MAPSSSQGKPHSRLVKRRRILPSPDQTPRKRRTAANYGTSELLAGSATNVHASGLDDRVSDCSPPRDSWQVGIDVADTERNLVSPPTVYTAKNDEILEDGSLEVPGETNWPEEDGDDLIPIRVLTDFSIYHRKTKESVSPLDLVAADRNPGVFTASGLVGPWSTDDSDEDLDAASDDSEEPFVKQRIQISGILEFNVHHHDFRRWMLDDKIYIRTKFAWYILAIPSHEYQHIYQPYWIQHQIFHLLLSAAMRNPDITYDRFVESLGYVSESPDAGPLALDILGRHVNEGDFEEDDVRAYVLAALEDYKCRLDVPLIRHLLGDRFSVDPLSDSDSDSSSYNEDDDKIRRTPAPRFNSPGQKTLVQKKMVGTRRTVVTEIVGKIAQQVYDMPMDVVRQQEDLDLNETTDRAPFIDVDDYSDVDMEGVQFLRRPIFEQRKDDATFRYYEKVNVNGTIYSIGDVVLLRRGHSTDLNRGLAAQARSSHPWVNMGWFARICYLFSKKTNTQTKFLFHGQWFYPSAKTIIQEAENPNELFLTYRCQDSIPLSTIVRKVSVQKVDSSELPPQNLGPEEFFYAFSWAPEDAAFLNLPKDSAIEEARSHCPKGKFCHACVLRRKAEHSATLRRHPGQKQAYIWHGVEFHVHDFVYVKLSQDGLYEIGQIIDVEFISRPCDGGDRNLSSKISLRMFERFSDPHQISPTLRTMSVLHDAIDGHCYVLRLGCAEDIEDWIRHPDHFFVLLQIDTADLTLSGQDTFPACEQCLLARVRELQEADEFRTQHTKLRGMELFSGAGGLGTGYALSGYIDTRWAVELAPSAAASYQFNHPHTIVYNVDASDALQNAIDQLRDNGPLPLRNINDDSPLPPMPRPGEVDFIYGGPPCQAFSFANWNKRVDDIRSTLICNTLAYVEHYRPEYFQLENVVGLLNFRLQGRQQGRCIVGGIQCGVVKFICRTLTALGYQCRFKILQAAQYGVPQSRERLIFWGARRDVHLPEFPLPSHFYAKAGREYKLPTFGTLRPVSRSLDPNVLHSCAALPALTVPDAIGDLPPFDWKNPYELVPPTIGNKVSDRRRRLELKIPSFDARTSTGTNAVGYTKPVEYVHPPMNRYQRAMRAGTSDNKVRDHFTRRFHTTIVERAVNIPMVPNANMSHLAPEYWPKSTTTKISQRPPRAEALGRRINAEGQFMTALTLVAPNTKSGPVLHPHQKRIVTVRECARAQGFPDHYEFKSTSGHLMERIKDQHRQIGNAVPVPLARALGECLGAALMKQQKEEDQRKVREVSPEC